MPWFNPYDNHDEDEQDAVDDTIRTDSQVTPVLSKSAVDEDYDEASATVHQEGRHADGESILDDFLFQAVNATFELDKLLGAAEDAHLPQQRDDLCQNRGRGSAAYAHVHPVNENRIEDGVSHHSHDGSVHGQLRMARRT